MAKNRKARTQRTPAKRGPAATTAALAATVKRSTIVSNLQSALRMPGIKMSTKFSSGTFLPGMADKFDYVCGACINYNAFQNDGMTSGNFLPIAMPQKSKVISKTLGDFEKLCLEAWYIAQGLTVDTAH
jgi:hypothetical protein